MIEGKGHRIARQVLNMHRLLIVGSYSDSTLDQ
jgi:hypothetical protein